MKCPYCEQELRDEAIFCKHCKKWFAEPGNFKPTNEPMSSAQMICPHCGKVNAISNTFCYECRRNLRDRKDKHDPFKEDKWGKVRGSILIIIILIIGVIFVPLLFPDFQNETPGQIMLYGLFSIVIGGIAWILGLTGKVEFGGGAGCIYIFPILGIIIIMYGLVRLIFP